MREVRIPVTFFPARRTDVAPEDPVVVIHPDHSMALADRVDLPPPPLPIGYVRHPDGSTALAIPSALSPPPGR